MFISTPPTFCSDAPPGASPPPGAASGGTDSLPGGSGPSSPPSVTLIQMRSATLTATQRGAVPRISAHSSWTSGCVRSSRPCVYTRAWRRSPCGLEVEW
jgi:hypothetical protein